MYTRAENKRYKGINRLFFPRCFENGLQSFIDFFNNLGYGCFVIEDGHLKCFGKVDEETLETNYFFLHKEKHEKIINELSIKGDKYEDALNNGK